jgi:thiol-disulfide isomerase/thioredoxin
VRKAYRALAKEYHPDKQVQHSENADIARGIFEEVAAAYGILGDSDNRAAFDDFGGGGGNDDDPDGFETYAEYKAALKKKEASGGAKGPGSFYTGASLVTNLSEDLWDRRVKGDQIWMVEFYAPWCTHCKAMTQIWKDTAEELEGDVQFGAVNCEMHRAWCMGKRWQIRSYPTVKIIHASEDVTETYPVNLHKTKESLLKFARTAMGDWRWLFGSSRVVPLNTLAAFNETLLHDPLERFWVVLFSDGWRCEDCMTAKTNMIRLSAAVKGVARVATVDCSVEKVGEGVDGISLNEVCAEHLGVDAGRTKLNGELPLIRGYAQGGAARKSLGSELIDPKEAGGAALVELLETTILLTMSDLMAEKKRKTEEQGGGEGGDND